MNMGINIQIYIIKVMNKKNNKINGLYILTTIFFNHLSFIVLYI